MLSENKYMKSPLVQSILLFILGAVLGFVVSKLLPSDLKMVLPLSCTYNGVKYANGEGFTAVDGCNSCSCQNGQVGCTMIACGDRVLEEKF